jgi:hypothetical protein
VLPPFGTPGSDRLNAVRWQPGAQAVLQRLRTELNTHQICPAISYDEGQAHLVISTKLTVWTDLDNKFFCWGAHLLEEPADHAPVDDTREVARRIAERVGKDNAEPTTAP